MAHRTMSTPFVAREREVESLTAALRRADEGEAAVLVVGADAGVGKSRLLAHVSELASAGGATAVTAHCVDLGEVGLPYLPFAEALVQLRTHPTAGEAVDAVIRSRPALHRLLPGSDAPPVPAGEDAGSRLQLFDGVAAALAAAGRRGAPLLLTVEDAHWADSSSRDVLRYLVARLRSEHVLLVVTYRSDDLHRTHPLRPLLAELWRHPRVERIDLEPFDPATLRRFAESVAGHPLSEADLRTVLERSEGNAYFAEELVEAGTGQALPWSLAEVLRSRVERLDPAVQDLARAASAAGRTVAEPLLRAVHARHSPLSDRFDELLREAVAAQVIVGEDGRLAFRHALLAEAVHADLLPGEQVALHRAYRDAIAEGPSLASAAELALHATRCHDLTTAFTASMRAAEEAARVLAPAERLRHLETALGLWDSVDGAEDLAGTDHAELLARAAWAASLAGEIERALTLGRRAIAEVDGDLVRRVPLRVVLARHLLSAEDLPGAVAEADGALEDLAAIGDAADPRVRAWALAVHARTALYRDQDDEARRSAEEAVATADLVDADDAAADALATLAVLVVEDPDRSAALLHDARDRARAAGDLVTEQRCTHNLVTTYYYAGRLEEAWETVTAGLARSRELALGYTEFAIGMRYFEALTRYCRGDLTPPEPFVGPGPSTLAPLFEAIGLYSAVARGDADAVARGRALEPMWERDSQIALLSGGPTIDGLLWAGEHEAALGLADRLIEHLGRAWDDYFLGRIWLSALALAALADAAEVERLTRTGTDAGAVTAAAVARGRELLDRAERTAERGRPRGGRLGPEGRAWLARARAELGRLSGEDDPALWERAVEEFGYGYQYEEARSRWRWAGALLDAGRRDEAAVQLGLAGATARRMGARPLADAVEALTRRARLDGGVARGAGDVLTAREAEVLTLVAEGLSNRQIGERLFISGKTVSVHVSNVLAKLGAATRAEAVTVAHRRGLLGSRPVGAPGARD